MGIQNKHLAVVKRIGRILFVPVVALLAIVVGASVVSALPSNSQLVAHWSFDQTSGTILTDDSGNGRHGTFSATPTWTAGKLGNSLKFDGTDNVAVGNVTQINNVGKLTLATWMKRNVSNGKVLIGKQTTNQDVAIEAWSDGKVYFQMSKGSDTYGTLALNDTAWHHVTLVFDGALSGNANRLKAYVDGVQKPLTFKGTVSTTTTANTTPFNIGKMGSDYSNGQIDDTWLYARALSQAEVQNLMQPTPDVTPPIAPAALSATAVSQTQINLSWPASTDNIGVTGYRIYRDGVERSTTTSTTFQDTGLTAGTTYNYTVRAYDAAGNMSVHSIAASATTQAPDTTAPTVTLTTPTDNATVSGTVQIAATASDDVAVGNVVFTINGTTQGAPDTSSPYGTSIDTTTLPNGIHTIRATATDTSGNSAYDEITVTVDNQAPPIDTTAPTVTISAPTAGATVAGNIVFSASADDNIGVTGVKFYVNGAQVGSEIAAQPYGVSWNSTNVANGPVQLTAVARDAAGNSATSDPVTVTVENVVASGHTYMTNISSNGRYFVDQHGAPVLIKGDSPWSMFSNLSVAEVEQWAANRESHGFNAAIVSLIGAPINGGAAPSGATYDGIQPFVGGNITNWNEAYWARMDTFMTILKDHGITALLYPMDGWNTLSGTAFSGKSTTDCYNYGRKVAERYAGYPNIVWMAGGDYNGYDSAVNARFQNMLAGIRSTGDTRLFTIQLNNETLSTDVTTFEPLSNWNFAYTYTTTYQKVLRGYNRVSSSRDPRPVLFSEGNYEGEDNYGGPATTNETLRRQQLWALTSGSAGDITGSQDWQFNAGWQSRLDTIWISQMQKNRDLFSNLQWYLLVPDDASPLVTAGRGIKITTDGSLDVLQNDYVTAAQTPDKSQTVIYIPTATGNTNARTITLDITRLPAGYVASWVDPTDATVTQPATIDAVGQVTTPGLHADGTRDWLLVIR